MPKLIVQQGYYERGEIDIPEGELIIGRDISCQFVIPDEQVSRQHAKITRQGSQVYVEDLNSYNGTFLNLVPCNGRQELKHMDVLQVCKNVFVYNESGMIEAEDDQPEEMREKTAAVFTFEFLRKTMGVIEKNVAEVFMGKSSIVRNVMICLLADGHVLLEDAPGVGKSILAQAVAKSLKGVYKRIQFTPDMLPSDITGISMYNEQAKEFKFMPGPVFGNIILADEINRTTPRTQSSLLECMNDAVVTIDGQPHVLPRPFFVMATQNPMDHHGTYPLPEAQLDRFLMRLHIGYPDEKVEYEILDSRVKGQPLNNISYVAKAMEIVQCQALVRQVHVSNPIKEYIIKIARQTRVHPALTLGVSPRASLALMRAGQALAAYSGRKYVLPGDIRELAVPVLAHRVALQLRAQAEFESPAAVIEKIVNSTPIDNEEDFE